MHGETVKCMWYKYYFQSWGTCKEKLVRGNKNLSEVPCLISTKKQEEMTLISVPHVY